MLCDTCAVLLTISGVLWNLSSTAHHSSKRLTGTFVAWPCHYSVFRTGCRPVSPSWYTDCPGGPHIGYVMIDMSTKLNRVTLSLE
ncbi:hypothetical protein BDV10DRAFT_176572 [Aspergillus recurvatus]